jgi:DNA-binding transcriptional MerR regulator
MYTIKNVSMITGIGVHTLRAWEKRYSVVVPDRSPSGRRFYSDDDIEKLKLIATLNKTGEQISSIAKLSLEELKETVGNLSEKDLYPDEADKLQSSLFILKKAFDLQVQDVLFHEFESMLGELEAGTYRLKSFVGQLLVPFYEHVVAIDETNPSLRPTCRTVYSLIAGNLKTVLAQLMDEFQNNQTERFENIQGKEEPILVGSSGTVKGEIDSLICCVKSYLNGKEAIYIGSLVDKDVISEFIDHMPSKKVVITDRYVSFRAHPRLFDLMKDLPHEKLEDVEFAVLLHRFNEMQKLDFQNSDKVEVLNSFDSLDQYFSAS